MEAGVSWDQKLKNCVEVSIRRGWILPPYRAGDSIFPSHSIRQEVLESLDLGRGRVEDGVSHETENRRMK